METIARAISQLGPPFGAVQVQTDASTPPLFVPLVGIGVVVALVVWWWQRSRSQRAVAELQERLARGEIGQDEYQIASRQLPVTSWRQLVLAVLALGVLGATPIVLGAAWNAVRLETSGVVAGGVVTDKHVEPATYRSPAFCTLLYSFVDPRSGVTIHSNDGQNCQDWPGYDQISIGDRVAITYLSDDPSVNKLQGRPVNLYLVAGVALNVVADAAIIIWAILFWTRWRARRATRPAGGPRPSEGRS